MSEIKKEPVNFFDKMPYKIMSAQFGFGALEIPRKFYPDGTSTFASEEEVKVYELIDQLQFAYATNHKLRVDRLQQCADWKGKFESILQEHAAAMLREAQLEREISILKQHIELMKKDSGKDLMKIMEAMNGKRIEIM